MTHDKLSALRDEIYAALGHMLNASIALESGGTKQEAIRILNDGMKRARAFLGEQN